MAHLLAKLATLARMELLCSACLLAGFILLGFACYFDLLKKTAFGSLDRGARFAFGLLRLLDFVGLSRSLTLVFKQISRKLCNTTIGLLCVRCLVCFALLGLCRLRLARSLCSHRSNLTWLRVCLDGLACSTCWALLPLIFMGDHKSKGNPFKNEPNPKL